MRYTEPMQGKTNATTHEQYIAEVEEKRRGDIQRLHDLVRETAPELEPTMEFGMLGYGKYVYTYARGCSRPEALGSSAMRSLSHVQQT